MRCGRSKVDDASAFDLRDIQGFKKMRVHTCHFGSRLRSSARKIIVFARPVREIVPLPKPRLTPRGGVQRELRDSVLGAENQQHGRRALQDTRAPCAAFYCGGHSGSGFTIILDRNSSRDKNGYKSSSGRDTKLPSGF